jgi:hypothetical protein
VATAHKFPNDYGVRVVYVGLQTPCHNEVLIVGISRVTKKIHSGAEEGFQTCLIAQEVEEGKVNPSTRP